MASSSSSSSLPLKPEEQGVLLRLRQKDPSLTMVKWMDYDARRADASFEALSRDLRGAPVMSVEIGAPSTRRLSDSVVRQLHVALRSLCNLRKLEASFVPMDGNMLGELTLEDMFLWDSSWKDIVEVASKVLSTTRTLTRLQLQVDERLEAASVISQLTEGLAHNSTLVRLLLTAPSLKIDPATFQSFCNAIAGHPTLAHLYLCDSNMGDGGMLALLSAVSQNVNICSVTLGATDLTDDGTQAYLDIQTIMEERKKRKPGIQFPWMRSSGPTQASVLRGAGVRAAHDDVGVRASISGVAHSCVNESKEDQDVEEMGYVAVQPPDHHGTSESSAADPSWNPQKPTAMLRQQLELHEAQLVRTVQELSMIETALGRTRADVDLQTTERQRQEELHRQQITTPTAQHQQQLDSHAAVVQEMNATNDEMRRQRTCIVCHDAEVVVVFTPCGHAVCCRSCSEQMALRCPACREFIMSRVRLYYLGI